MSVASEITRLQNAKAALKESIEAKGVTVEDSTKLDEYPALVDSIPQGGGGGVEEKDVNFYDYDGTCVYSYTKDEFLALSEMPTLPDHSEEGAIADNWSCTFEYARIAAKMGHFSVIALYTILDGNVKIFIELPKETLIPLELTFTGAFESGTINWGDGTITEITSVAQTSFSHNFAAGAYIIQLTANDGCGLLISPNRGIFGNDFKYNYLSKYVKKIFFGYKGYYNAVSGCLYSLLPYTKVIIDSKINDNDGLFTYNNYNKYVSVINTTNNNITNTTIKSLYFKEVTVIGNNCEYATNIIDLIVLDTLSTINMDYFLRYSYNLQTIHLPNTITIIRGFPNSYSISCFCCFANIPPTLMSGVLTTFKRCGNLKIYVPAESIEAYKTATNWSDLADKIFPIPTE